ncbi:hypothetical protein PG984_000238 [Apiospora sp. TS-2023a]
MTVTSSPEPGHELLVCLLNDPLPATTPSQVVADTSKMPPAESGHELAKDAAYRKLDEFKNNPRPKNLTEYMCIGPIACYGGEKELPVQMGE